MTRFYPNCRGSLTLGSACGFCPRCVAERPERLAPGGDLAPLGAPKATDPADAAAAERLEALDAEADGGFQSKGTRFRDLDELRAWLRKGGSLQYGETVKVGALVDQLLAELERARVDAGAMGLVVEQQDRDLARMRRELDAAAAPSWGLGK